MHNSFNIISSGSYGPWNGQFHMKPKTVVLISIIANSVLQSIVFAIAVACAESFAIKSVQRKLINVGIGSLCTVVSVFSFFWFYGLAENEIEMRIIIHGWRTRRNRNEYVHTQARAPALFLFFLTINQWLLYTAIIKTNNREFLFGSSSLAQCVPYIIIQKLVCIRHLLFQFEFFTAHQNKNQFNSY